MPAGFAHVAVFEFPAGETRTQRQLVGPLVGQAQGGNAGPAPVGSLRVAYRGAHDGAVSCTLVLPDGRLELDGLDLPLELAVELPVRLELTPTAALGGPVTVVATVTETRPHETWGATRTVLVEAGTPVPVPWWARAVTVVDSAAAGEWQDAAGAPIGSISPEVPRVRPASAEQLDVTATSLVVFHATT